ncbi:MAG: hypothetical protein EP343_05905 [Deltaproteobacteria bacterium]|nr:MAG: hypothetical protein EP343_05905 [Deltaproteobacteria bacterium]
MSESSTTAASSSPSRGFAFGVGSLGAAATLFAVLFGIVLPVFVPPLLKWDGYASLWLPVLWCFVLGPWLAVWGLFVHYQQPRARLRQTLQTLLAAQLLLASLVWLGWDIFRLQKVGWLAFLRVPKWKFPFYGIWAGPPLLAFSLSLLTLKKWRNHLGVMISTAAYTALVFLGLYISFYFMAPKFVVILDTSAFQMRKVGLTWGGIAMGAGLIGAFLMTSGTRLRFHLLMTSPVWLPFFVVFFFWSLVVHTTLYFLEDLLGWEWQPSRASKVSVVSWLSLLLFPVLLTVDFCIGLMRFLGQAVIDRLFPPAERLSGEQPITLSPSWTYAAGAVLLFTAPLWFLPAALFWSARLFVYESLLVPLFKNSPVE